ncbi:hypothetical protein SAMN02990966_05853 [Rhodospirillales bacterium URHD0017]|nr:hypothetical protein SAMN02990966_05853 [Rhodospirillales bacterium URHD0017]
MSDLPSKAPSPIVCYGLAVYLIGSLLWRVLIPAHEYPGSTALYLGMAVDLLAIIGLVGIRAGVPKALFWIALIAGLGLFAIRLTSTASWWTGHLMYSVR